jgi:hypothetical protein
MHGPMNIKFIDAKQAKELYQFKNIKIKPYRTQLSGTTKYVGVPTQQRKRMEVDPVCKCQKL